ncbi:hypothetical protein GCM10028790_02250 [Micromonospora taraxaci]
MRTRSGSVMTGVPPVEPFSWFFCAIGRTSLSRWWVATAARREAARGECAAISSGGLLHSGNGTGGWVSWLTPWPDLTPVAG